MSSWSPYPHPGEFRFDAESVRAQWNRLHMGDAEPLPGDPDVLAAWALLHSGQFEEAVAAGLKAGTAGVSVANRATGVYATYLEKKEKTRLELFQQVAQRAEAQTKAEPHNPSGWFWWGYGLGRYSQGISVAKALAQGLGGRIREALEQAVALQPRHADAHVALGTFHAEVIDKVGALIGSMTHGAKKDAGLQHFAEALRLNPQSPIALMDYANGLLMLEGESHQAQAQRLYEQAAAVQPVDAVERLQVDLARSELQAAP